MKQDKTGWLAILAESVNCVVVQYALSNTAMLMQANPLLVLLVAAKLWTWSRFWQKIGVLCRSKALSAVLTALCLVAEMCLFYFVGHAEGEIVPF